MKKDEEFRVSADIVYQEMYAEMRRHRDYELSAANWCTVILLAIIGGFITLAADENTCLGQQSPIVVLWLKLLATLMVLLIGFSGVYIVDYSSKRYTHMRKWVTSNLEPTIKFYRPEKVNLRMKDLLPMNLTLMTLISGIVIWIL